VSVTDPASLDASVDLCGAASLALPPEFPLDPGARTRSFVATWARDPRPYLWLIAVAIVLPEFWHQLFVRGDLFVVDLHVYRLSGLDLLHHRPVYSWYYQTPTATLPFTYPPIAAVLSVPLAVLPARVDAAVWFLGVYVVLAWVLRVVAEPARARLRVERPRLEPFLLPALWCSSTYLVPGLQQIHLGQVGVFLLGLIVLDQLTPRTGRFRGVLTGLAAAIKLTPLVFVAVFLAGRRFREAAMALGSFVALGALTWVVAPASSKTFWTDTVIHSDRLGDNTDPTNQSIRGALLRTSLHGAPSTLLWIGLCLVVLVAGLFVTTQAYHDGDPLLVATVGGFLSCLLSPVAWIHHYVYVFLLVAWLLRERHAVLALATTWFWALNWTGSSRHHALTGGAAGVWWHLVGDLFCLYAVAAIGVLARRAWQRADGRAGLRAMLSPAVRPMRTAAAAV
jgi:alpha-1,2-mannosyltransferase